MVPFLACQRRVSLRIIRLFNYEKIIIVFAKINEQVISETSTQVKTMLLLVAKDGG